jgi:hypothetical protein
MLYSACNAAHISCTFCGHSNIAATDAVAVLAKCSFKGLASIWREFVCFRVMTYLVYSMCTPVSHTKHAPMNGARNVSMRSNNLSEVAAQGLGIYVRCQAINGKLLLFMELNQPSGRLMLRAVQIHAALVMRTMTEVRAGPSRPLSRVG